MLTKSLFLIGLPGSGKSTLGKLLAQRLDCAFIDMDELIVAQTGQSIQSLFAQGEDVFRDAESDVCQLLREHPPSVVACGGGVVKRAVNIRRLRQKGILIFIDRPVSEIIADVDTSSRPLLAQGAHRVHALYEERAPLYRQYADLCIENTGTAPQAITKIIHALTEKEMLP